MQPYGEAEVSQETQHPLRGTLKQPQTLLPPLLMVHSKGQRKSS
jgi:hypothetical protein